MKVKLLKLVEVEAKTLHVKAGVRYWEDATVDGVEDENGMLIPCRDEEHWLPVIDIDSGKITNWEQGKIADIHYKVCDDLVCAILDENKEELLSFEGYVPKTLSPKGSGYGDYIKMYIDSNGFIQNWNFNIKDFTEEDEN